MQQPLQLTCLLGAYPPTRLANVEALRSLTLSEDLRCSILACYCGVCQKTGHWVAGYLTVLRDW